MTGSQDYVLNTTDLGKEVKRQSKDSKTATAHVLPKNHQSSSVLVEKNGQGKDFYSNRPSLISKNDTPLLAIITLTTHSGTLACRAETRLFYATALSQE